MADVIDLTKRRTWRDELRERAQNLFMRGFLPLEDYEEVMSVLRHGLSRRDGHLAQVIPLTPPAAAPPAPTPDTAAPADPPSELP